MKILSSDKKTTSGTKRSKITDEMISVVSREVGLETRELSQLIDHQVYNHRVWVEDVADNEFLRFKSPDTGICAMDYTVRYNRLLVTGDMGDAVYAWSDQVTLEWISRCDTNYFHNKCTASEFGRDFSQWDSKRATEVIQQHIEDEEASAKANGYEITMGADALDSYVFDNLFSKEEWMIWADQHAHDVFGEYWHESLCDPGTVIAHRCRYHLAGLKLCALSQKWPQGL